MRGQRRRLSAISSLTEVAASFGLAASTSWEATSCVTGMKSLTTSNGSAR
jgi:hypothetical protein